MKSFELPGFSRQYPAEHPSLDISFVHLHSQYACNLVNLARTTLLGFGLHLSADLSDIDTSQHPNLPHFR
jgi:hypothetical protein